MAIDGSPLPSFPAGTRLRDPTPTPLVHALAFEFSASPSGNAPRSDIDRVACEFVSLAVGLDGREVCLVAGMAQQVGNSFQRRHILARQY
jgi:hypothetical protein